MKKLSISFVLGASLITVGLGVFFGAEYFTDQRSADATIVASGVKHERTVYYNYAYVAGGESHTGGVHYHWRGGRRAAENRVASEHPVGKKITVYYDLAKPGSSRQWRGDKITTVQVIGITVVLIGALGLLPAKANPLYRFKESANRHRVFRDPQRLAKLAAGLLCAGGLIFVVALLSGTQGTIVVLCPLGLVLVLAGFLTGIPARRIMLGRIAISVGLAGLIVAVSIFVFIMILAVGFGSIR